MSFRYLYIILLLGLVSACQKIKTEAGKITPNLAYDTAYEFREAGQADSAYYYFSIAKDEFLKQKDSLGVAKCLVNLAIANTNKGDYYGGIETGLIALDFFDTNNPQHATYLNSNYINLGLAHYYIKDLDKALTFYHDALNYAVDLDDSLVAINNAGKMYEEKSDFKQSIAYFNRVIEMSKSEPLHYGRALANVAVSKWKANKSYNPIPELLESVRIRESIDDSGVIYSYIALSDVFIEKDRNTARTYAFKALNLSNQYKQDDDRMGALRRLVILSPELEAQNHFVNYTRISDSLQRSWGNARNKYAMIRYETELYKSQKTILEKDNHIKSIQISLLVLGILIVVGLSVVYVRRTKFIANLKAQRHIQENRLKTSKQVHDVVANGLYRVMSEIENTDFKKDEILDKLELMYEKSRDISYDEDSVKSKKSEVSDDESYETRLISMINSFNSDKQIVVIEDSIVPLTGFNAMQENALYIIIQELLVNATKHSQATLIKLKASVESGKYTLIYQDNGVGMPSGYPKNNGLKNTVNRINQLNGLINFVNESDSGLSIQIEFPLK